MTDTRRHIAGLTIAYTGRTNCAGCNRGCGISQPVYIINGTPQGYADGNYCRRCAGPMVLDLISADAGIDAQVDFEANACYQQHHA